MKFQLSLVALSVCLFSSLIYSQTHAEHRLIDLNFTGTSDFAIKDSTFTLHEVFSTYAAKPRVEVHSDRST